VLHRGSIITNAFSWLLSRVAGLEAKELRICTFVFIKFKEIPVVVVNIHWHKT
jgi:hypothetical protein